MDKTKIAILGFGSLGQTLLRTIKEDPAFAQRFEVAALWNRSPGVLDEVKVPGGITICKTLEDVYTLLPELDLVVECAHPQVVQQTADKVLARSDYFVSSPTALSDATTQQKIEAVMGQSGQRCYIPLGASLGVWDILRLDRAGQLQSLEVTMTKHPSSFKVKDAAVLAKLATAAEGGEAVTIASGDVRTINSIAPQNTNTMAIYALAAHSLGFMNCEGRLVADSKMTAHWVELKAETKGGLKLALLRDNPARHGAVTGSATFGSFLQSLLHYRKGVVHHGWWFC